MKTRALALDRSKLRTTDEGIAEGYACIWGVVDSYGTRWHRDTFKRTLDDEAARSLLRHLMHHDPTRPVALIEEIEADATGLRFKSRRVAASRRAADDWEDVRAGLVPAMSFRFDGEVTEQSADGVVDMVDADLMEISSVTCGSVPGALIESVRQRDSKAPAAIVEAIARDTTQPDATRAAADALLRHLRGEQATPPPNARIMREMSELRAALAMRGIAHEIRALQAALTHRGGG
jgi:HK97 family phage prohead protease